MRPPTPHSGPLKSVSATHADTASKAFRELTGKMNAVSRSTEQDPKLVITKVEGKEKKSNTTSRRHSVVPSSSSINKLKTGDGTPDPDGNPQMASLQRMVHDKSITRQTSRSLNKSQLWGNTTTARIPNVAKVNNKNYPIQSEQANLHTRSSIRSGRKLTSGLVKGPAVSGNDFKTRDPNLLRTASYWLDQVKLAEAIGKHAVAIGFFRLAIECEAEPVQALREELILYRRRHTMFLDSIHQVMLCYGIVEEVEEPPFIQVPKVGISMPSSTWEHEEHPGKLFVTDSVSQQQTSVEPSCIAADERPEINLATNEQVEVKLGVKTAAHLNKADAQFVIQDVPKDKAILGHVMAMDVDSVTREVVSYIMSSLDNCNSPAVKDGVSLVGPDFGQKSNAFINASESKNANIHELKDSALSTVPNSYMPKLIAWNTVSIENVLVVQDMSLNNQVVGKLSTLDAEPECVEMSDTSSQDRSYNGNENASKTDELEVPQNVVIENGCAGLSVQEIQEHSNDMSIGKEYDGKACLMTKGRRASISSKENSYGENDTVVHKLVSQHGEKKPVSSTLRPFAKAEARDAFTQASGSITRNRAKSNMALVSNGDGGSSLLLETQLKSPIPSMATPSQTTVSRSKCGSKEASVNTLEMRGRCELSAEVQAVTPGMSSVRRSARLRPVSATTAQSTPRHRSRQPKL